MKKLISILLVAAILFSHSISVFAADTTPTLTVSSATAEVGEEVILEVNMTEATFAAFGLQILYDKEALELKKITKGDPMDDFFAFSGSKKSGKVTAINSEDLDVEGVIFTMTFTVLAEGTHTVELDIDSFNYADQSELEVTAVAGAISVPGAEEPEVPVDPGVIYEGSMEVETTDTYGYFDKYSMIAPVTGTYTFSVPAGLGVWEAEGYETDWSSAPEIDFYDNVEGFSFTMDLTEGEEFSFYVGATTKDTWTITYTVTETEQGEDPVDPIDPVIPEDAVDLTIGNNAINAADVTFVYIAPSAGTLILNLGNSIMGPVEAEVTVNFANAQTLSTLGRIELALNEGDVVLVAFTATGYATMTAEWESDEPVLCEHEYVDGVCIHCGEEDPNYVPPTEPDGSMNNPFIIGQMPYTVEQDTTADLYYQWGATEDGVLYVYYTDGYCSMSGSSVGGWENTDGGKYIEVAAGDVIIINYWNGTGFIAEFVPAGEEHVCEFVETERVEATCTEAGYVVYTCSCGNAYNEEIPALGHSYEAVVTEPTCTEPGFTTYTCSVCGDTYVGDEVAALGHDLVVMEELAPTCTEYGFTVRGCSNCGETWTEEIAPIGHSYYLDAVVEPTCTEAGYWIRRCSNCGDSYVEDSHEPALGHNVYYCAPVEPTTTSTGIFQEVCMRCDAVTMSIVLPALNETDYNYEVIVEPTYETEGQATYTWNNGDYGLVRFYVTLDQLVMPEGMLLRVDNVTARPGDTIEVPVYISGNTGFSYLRLQLEYDADVFEFVSATNGTVAVEDFTAANNLIWLETVDTMENGLLVTLTFVVKEEAAEGAYSISAEIKECYNEQYADVPMEVVSGTVTVANVMYGDVNGDGEIDGRDLLKLKRYLANYDDETGTSTEEISAGADVNGDGKVDGRDLLKLKRYLANYDDETGTSTEPLGPTAKP